MIFLGRKLTTRARADIPAIVVDDLLATPPLVTRDITSPGRNGSFERFADPESPLSPTFPDFTLTPDSPTHSYSRRRVSDISMMSLSPGLSCVFTTVSTCPC